MKKLLLVVSLLLPFCFSFLDVDEANIVNVSNDDCGTYGSSVMVINNYNVFESSGFIYDIDENYTYIVTSSNIVNDTNNFGVIFEDNSYLSAIILGYDLNDGIAVLRTSKKDNVKEVCLADSSYLIKGQANYLYGYLDKDIEYFNKGFINSVGYLFNVDSYRNIYRNVVGVEWNDRLIGIGTFDGFNRLTGIVVGYDQKLQGSSFVLESDKIKKIVDSIIKTRKYDANYIKYKIDNLSNLGLSLRKSYGINDNVKKGVAVITFKPFNYVFGGLNQGMVIVAVNGVEVDSVYEFDKQLLRYEKKQKVCLKVIKKNGKEAYYYVKI